MASDTGWARFRRAARRWVPATLRSRLALLAAGIVAAWVVVLTAGAVEVLDHRLAAQADDLLRTRAEAVVTTVTAGPDGSIRVADAARDEALDADVWIFAGPRLLEGAKRPVRVYRAVSLLAQSGNGFRDVEVPADTRLYAQPVLRQGQRVAVVVTATSLTPYRHAMRVALAVLLGTAGLLLAAVYLVTRVIVARALTPVAQMADQASAWSAAAATGRFGSADLPDELALLARSLDEMLDRTAAVLRHEQRLTGELSHELRTPLSRILAETELLQDEGTDEALAAKNIRTTALQMSSLLDTLLSAARATPASTPGRCDLREVLAGLDEAPRPEGVILETVSPPSGPLLVGADRELVERLLMPLLENAFRYARSSVVLAATPAPRGRVTIEVVDDGPGVPAEVGERVFDPGIRGDPEDGHNGAGLGLPLARRLARAAGGTVELSPGAAGAVFRVTLPAG